MFAAALNTEISRGSSIDWRARSWMPSQFRCAWLLMRPGMIVPPVDTRVPRPVGISPRAPTAAIFPASISTKPSSMSAPAMVSTRPVSTRCGVGRSNMGLVIFW